MRKKIAIDMDDTIANLLLNWTEAINEYEGESVSREDIVCWQISKYFKCGDKVHSYLNYDLFRGLPVIEDSQRVVRALMESYDVYIVTSATNNIHSLVAKMEWLQEHFDFIPSSNVVLCGKKDIIKADIMIDDGVHNLESFDGYGILFDATHNRKDQKFKRTKSWNEIEELLL